MAKGNMQMKFSESWIPDEWKNKVSVEDDLLPVTHFNQIESYVNSIEFPWNYTNNISLKNDSSSDSIDNYTFGYSSVVLNNVLQNEQGNQILSSLPINPKSSLSRDFASFLTPLLYFINDHIGFDFILKARFDMTTRTPNKEYLQNPHVDYNKQFPHISCIIYMNDSDGDTIIFNERSENYSTEELDKISIDDLTIKKRVQPKKGRVVLFDGSLIHTGCSPYNNKNRILLNSNFTNTPKIKKAW